MDPREVRARDTQASIQAILLKDWDPIGIQDVPEAQDEYDGYVGGVYRLLANDASVEAIAEHLGTVERDSMGLSTPSSSLLTVAHKLKQLDVRLTPA